MLSAVPQLDRQEFSYRATVGFPCWGHSTASDATRCPPAEKRLPMLAPNAPILGESEPSVHNRATTVKRG